MSVFGDMQAMQWRRQQIAENSGREMFEVITVETTGVGQSLLGSPVMFKGPFPNRPSVMYGSDIVGGVDLNFWSLPLCSGSVFKYVRNEQGFFTGAYLAIRVDLTQLEPGATIADPKILHSFTLLGVSIKDVSTAARGLAGALPVRSVDL